MVLTLDNVHIKEITLMRGVIVEWFILRAPFVFRGFFLTNYPQESQILDFIW